MKIGFVLYLLTGFQLASAATLQVPENCLKEKVVPCLAKSIDKQDFKFDDQSLHIVVDGEAIVKWTSFEDGPQLQLLRGQFKIEGIGFQGAKHNNSSNGFKVNGILIPPEIKSAFVRKVEEKIEVLDLKTFTLTTFNQPDILTTPISASRFLDKEEFVKYSSLFFKTTKSFLSFLGSIEKSWKVQFENQSISQTNVLKRSIASIQDEKEKNEAQRLANQIKLKKVRELFFFRTFYR